MSARQPSTRSSWTHLHGRHIDSTVDSMWQGFICLIFAWSGEWFDRRKIKTLECSLTHFPTCAGPCSFRFRCVDLGTQCNHIYLEVTWNDLHCGKECLRYDSHLESSLLLNLGGRQWSDIFVVDSCGFIPNCSQWPWNRNSSFTP